MLPRLANIMGSIYKVICAKSPAASAHWFGGVPRIIWYFEGGKYDRPGQHSEGLVFYLGPQSWMCFGCGLGVGPQSWVCFGCVLV